MGGADVRRGWAIVAVAIAASALLAAAPTAGAKKAKLAIYNVTLGLTGQASEVGSGMCGDVKTSVTVCEVNDHASYHVDEEFRDAIFVTGGGRARFPLPSQAGGWRHVVNGSVTEAGAAYQGEEHPEPFSCSSSLSAQAADTGSSHMLTWRQRRGSYQFTAETESYGLEGTVAGSGWCNTQGWFGNGVVLYPPESRARFTIPASDFGRRSFTKTVGSNPGHERCGSWSTGFGGCSYTWGWHAVVKFKLKKLAPL